MGPKKAHIVSLLMIPNVVHTMQDRNCLVYARFQTCGSGMERYFFIQSELIEPVLPQAAQQGILFLLLSEYTVRHAPP